MSVKKAKHIVLGVTASVAIYKACDLIRRLRERGCTVSVVMTADALRFVTEVPFKTLSRNPVVKCLYDTDDDWVPQHISLADWADVVVIAPATANTIAKIACGIADNALTCLALAMRPETGLLIAPAMNGRMWSHDATVENVRILNCRGVRMIGPAEGLQACGYSGKGRMSPVEEVGAQVIEMLRERNLA